MIISTPAQSTTRADQRQLALTAAAEELDEAIALAYMHKHLMFKHLM